MSGTSAALCDLRPPLPTTFDSANTTAIFSNKPSSAQTDAKTVMAEQIGHNVVNHPQSTSGSPLVDVASTSNPAQPATSGTQTSPTNPDVSTAQIYNSKLSDESTIAANAPTDGQTGPDATRSAVKPSAGDVAPKAVDGSSLDAATQAGNKPGAQATELLNGHRDDVSLGDGIADDRSTADISVDVSINSDTDNSRADLAEKKDGNNHVRTNSVKKPTAFSKVTATKNFMNKIAPSAPVIPKMGEKPIPVATMALPASSKPRLVAKTGASLANTQKLRIGGESSGGPDASKVWNKNRPVAPPPPRQFTDEELKQQYGIHLATRLQTDEGGKDSKWADIDDDEDDWAPEAVVWIDGTKSTLTPQDAVPPSQEEPKEKDQPSQKPAPALVKPADGVRPVLALKQRSDMKILKPGAAGAQAKQDGPSAPSPGPEKQSLKAKAAPQAPAPAPAKSPWAPVPKVESVSPVNPPIQQPPAPRAMPSQDARSYEPQVAAPAREIAADTFDRHWREGEGGARELFNSANGRYEPAPEGRRTSVKQDSAFRKPAVLQRPSQSGAAPAEPSTAFQSRTAAPLEGSWGRRRGSSVSQGSLPLGRRMSVNQRPELAQTPEVPQDARSPRTARAEPGKPTFSQQSAWDQQMPVKPDGPVEPAAPAAPAAPVEPMEDPVVVQERIMREKREMAVKRRKEEEREEAEKQQRLKAKLAALAGAGKSKKEREAEAAAAAAAAKESAVAEKPTEPAQKVVQPEPVKPAEVSAAVAPALESQVLPAATEAKQSLATENLPSPLPPMPLPAAVPDRSVSNDHTRQDPPRSHLSPRAGARAPYQQPPASSYKTPTSSYSSPGDRKLQPAFGRSPNIGNDTFTPWPTTAPNSNVWGSSGIGNGTFESASSFAPIQSSTLPPPPGMARTGTTSTRISPQSFNQDSRSPSMQQQQVSEQQRAFPPPGMDSHPEPFPSQSRLNGVSAAPGAGRPVHMPGPIGPPSRAQQQQPQSAQRGDPIAAWNNATQALPNQYQRDIAAAEERRRQESNAPVKPAENTYKETFKKTSATQGRLGAPRRYETTEYTIHDGQGSHSVSSLSPAPPATQTQAPAPFTAASPLQQGPWKQPPESAVRIPDPSMNPAHGGAPMQQPPIAPPVAPHQRVTAYPGNTRFPTAPIAPIVEANEQSPPPPDTESHPVNAGDANHPHVRLPPPQAKVKLPPTSPSGIAHVPLQNNNGSVLMPQRPFTASPWGPPGVNRPIVQQQAWQARFNGLLGRAQVSTETPPSPPKTPPKMQGPSPAVASSSRTAMDVQSTGATVSLPQSRKRLSHEDFIIDHSSDCSSKPTIDAVFEEERSFGSMPKVNVPRSARYNNSAYQTNARNMLEFPKSRLQKSVDTETRENPYFWRHPDGIFVTIPQTRFHNRLVYRPGFVAPVRPPRNGERKASVQNSEREERRPSGRFNKHKNHDDASETADKVHATAGQKKPANPKPSRQPSDTAVVAKGEIASGGDEVSKGESAGEKRKTGSVRGGRGGRGGRNAAAAPTSAPPVNSN